MKIGIFDSGIGGLTVLRQALTQLPDAHYIYFGDTGRFPYGSKAPKTITQYAIENTLFLLEQKVDAIVVACNTATSCALEKLQSMFSIPILGVIEPAAVEADRVSQNRRIGLIATRATIASKAFQKALTPYPDAQVYWRSCPLLVTLIEEQFKEKNITKQLIAYYLQPLLKQKIDTLVLGCTHYPLLKEEIAAVIGHEINIIDPAMACVKKLKLLASSSASPSSSRIDFFVSDDPERFKRAGKHFLGLPITRVTKV